MLPCIFPAFPERQEFDVYASMTPAKEVGGDFYDFFLVDDDHLALVIADVSGKRRTGGAVYGDCKNPFEKPGTNRKVTKRSVGDCEIISFVKTMKQGFL